MDLYDQLNKINNIPEEKKKNDKVVYLNLEDLKNEKNRTIDMALELMKSNLNDFDDFKVKELSFYMVLFGLAEIQADRISRLSNIVKSLENKIFSEEVSGELNTKQLISLYKMSLESLKDSSEYLQSLTSSINWNKVEGSFLALQEREKTNQNSTEVNNSEERKIFDYLEKHVFPNLE
jgi:hypothetical protein